MITIYKYIYIYSAFPVEFLMVTFDTPASAYGGFTDEFDKGGKNTRCNLSSNYKEFTAARWK